jgi:hypothetical protein
MAFTLKTLTVTHLRNPGRRNQKQLGEWTVTNCRHSVEARERVSRDLNIPVVELHCNDVPVTET